ncbi:hypothetical protein RGQ29_017890 [Quercus rubra]|uniref:peroxidase n=1 Tax=Quercus rubra TaxID=3512 RepID=A0AAN7IYD5_QUERU|nr:hypothetical protein RGQ29_017890 [Quercus rubra]
MVIKTSIERQVIPNQTLRGFDKIDSIKEELEKACPGVVSCADIVSIATRDGIILLSQIPRLDDNIIQTLHLFAHRGFDEREIVSLLGEHNIGKIDRELIQKHLSDFKGTRQPDPTISPDFLTISEDENDLPRQ